MFVYRNSNTGATYETETRSVRLDHLPNWLLIDASEEPTESATTDTTGGMAAPAPSTVTVPFVPSRPTRPLDSDNKAAWVAYAVYRGMAEKDAKALSKAALIQEFGEEDTDGED